MCLINNKLFIACSFVLLLQSSIAAQHDPKTVDQEVALETFGQEPAQPIVVNMLPAVVEPVQSVSMSVPVDGVLMNVNVSEGDRVQRDQILAVIDNRIAAASLKSALATTKRTAAIRGAEYALDSAKRQFARLSKLGNAVSGAELDQVKDAIAKAESDLDLAKEQKRESFVQLELEKARLNSHNARAPFNGVIIQINGRPGQSMTRSDPLLMIANMKRLQTNLHVPIDWFGRIKVGDRCQLKAEAPVNQILIGNIVSVEPRIDTATKTFRCKVEIANADQQLPAGFSVRLVQPNQIDIVQPSRQKANPISYQNDVGSFEQNDDHAIRLPGAPLVPSELIPNFHAGELPFVDSP